MTGCICICSLMGSQQQAVPSSRVEESFGASLDNVAPPKWLRKPCGASFGFGGKLVTVEQVFVFVSMVLSGSLFVFAGTWVPPVPVPEHCGDGASPGGGQC